RLAEEVVEDRLRRAQRLVRDAWRVPDEEGLHAELGRARVRNAVQQGVEEPEHVAQVEGCLRVVQGLQVAAAVGRRPRGGGGAVRASEAPLAGAGAGIEPVVPDRAGELAAEERAVAERAQRARDGAEGGRRPALALHALLVAAREDAGERGKAPRRGVVGDGKDRAVPG